MSAAWAVLLVEPLHGVTFALAWVGAIDHVAKPAVSGEGLQASSQGLLTACFLGLGPIIGLLGGGLLFDTVGGHAAYAIFAVFVSVSGLIYWSRSHIEEAEPDGTSHASQIIGKQHLSPTCTADADSAGEEANLST